jgi:hypothetical protein
MNREGISKVRRAELLARLVALDAQIADQAERVRRGIERGWNVRLSQQRLGALTDSRNLYRSALRHLLGDDPLDPAGATD